MMKRICGVVLFLLVILMLAFVYRTEVESHKHQETLAVEYARVIDNVNRSMAGKDGVITDEEKVGFLRFLGIQQPIQSGQVLQVQAHRRDNTAVYDDSFMFDVVLGQEVQQGRGVMYVTPPKVLGTFPKSKLEEFANVNVKWIE